MKSTIKFYFALVFMVLIPFIKGYAQQAEKMDKKMKAALDARYNIDKSYAEGKRFAFNRSSWTGKKLSDLIASWGPATRIVSDGADGQIAVYEKSHSYKMGDYTPGFITTATNGFGQTVVLDYKAATDTRATRQYSESTAVYTDKNKIITKVDFHNSYK